MNEPQHHDSGADGPPVGDAATDRSLWQQYAPWWQEHFTDGADPEYEEQILPLLDERLRGFATVCDLGCGEGQVARRLSAAGATLVVGVEPSQAQVSEARRRGGGPLYVQGDASAIPLATDSVDAVVVCLVFEHLDDIEPPITEIARILRPGGRFVLMLNHPLLQTPDSGWVDDHLVDPPEQYWQVGNYLAPAAVVEEVAKGVFIRFVHRPLSQYLNAAAGAGLVFESMDEPAPPAGFLTAAPEYPDADHIPRLMVQQWRAPGGPTLNTGPNHLD
jgi:SAM-dependent methyltransferase